MRRQRFPTLALKLIIHTTLILASQVSWPARNLPTNHNTHHSLSMVGMTL